MNKPAFIGLICYSAFTTTTIGLKLTGIISWSWLWVLSPIWIPFVIQIFIFVLCFFDYISDSIDRFLYP
jgi:hypothetical protein